MPYPCFLLEPVGRIRVWARRYSNGTPNCCPNSPGEYSYHQNMNLIGDFDRPFTGQSEDWLDFLETIRPPASDPLWPTTCTCGAVFEDSRIQRGGQMFANRLFKRSDTGELTTLQEAPAGALWYAWWYNHEPADGLYGWDWDNMTGPPLICRCPGGHDWNIDGRASNCDKKEDRLHRCWVRHGAPPNLHVDKNGLTCGAGAGSILAGKYHGFLHNGELTDHC